jgi:hypothetical protein
VETLRDGQAIAQAPIVLADADSSGRIQHIAQASVDTLDPGRYTLRVTIRQGERREIRDALFELTR